MAYTMQQVVDLARQPLEDDDKERYSDAKLLAYAKSALLMLRSKRPDLFFGAFETELALAALVLANDFPIEDEYAQPVADYVAARASTHDAEHVVTGRAKLFFDLFSGSAM